MTNYYSKRILLLTALDNYENKLLSEQVSHEVVLVQKSDFYAVVQNKNREYGTVACRSECTKCYGD